MSYILLLVFSAVNFVPKTFTMSEFQTKSACEVALKEAKSFYRTVNNESRCVSVESELKKEKLKNDLEKAEQND